MKTKTLAGPGGGELKIEWRDPAALKPYGRNAKSHPKEQVEGIAKQISSFGWDQPIVVLKDGVIVKGHGRREAALLLGLKRVPVVVTKLTAKQAAAARIGDNKSTESAWLHDLLRLEFNWLREQGADLTLTGFDVNELNALSDAWSANPKALASIEENSDPGRAVIKVKCPHEHKANVQKAIIAALEKTDLFGLIEMA